jgi:hypothetical protein
MMHQVSTITLAAATMAGVPTHERQPEPELAFSLASIHELRVLDLPADEQVDADEFFFTMSGEAPALSLQWSVELPAGTSLVSVENLRELEASDSTGRDLAPEDPGSALTAMPRYEFGEFGEEPVEILDSVTITLALPDRKAESFSLAAQADATISTGESEVKIALSDQWQTLAAENFGGEAVRVRLSREMGEVIGVEFSPASAAERAIASLRLNVEGDELEDSGSMSDYSTITWFFDAMVDEGEPADLTMTVRTGLTTIPIRFEVKDQKLP